MEKYKLYTLTDNNDNIFYVGITSKELSKRLSVHICECKTKITNKCLHIKSLINQGIRPNINLIRDDFNNDYELKNAEIFYIDKFIKEGIKLTNSTIGGEGVNGLKHKQETIEKISKNRKGKNMGKRPDISGEKSPMYGKVYTKEEREEMSRLRKGKHPSLESRIKMSLSHLGEKNNNYGKSFNSSHKNKISLSNKGKHYFDRTSFTKDDIINIRLLHKEGRSVDDISKIYNQSYRKIRDIINNVTFKFLK